MNFSQQLIFLFSALGAVNGFLLSGYFLLIKRPIRLSDRFLGGLLLMLSIRIIKSVFRHFNPQLFEVFVQFGLGACLLIGPFLYLYVTSSTSSDHRLRKRWWWLVLPFVAGFSVLCFRYSYYDQRPLWINFIEGIYKIWLVFILLSAYRMRAVFQRFFQDRKQLEDREIWLINVFVGTTLIWLAYDTSQYTSYIVGALSFSFIFYLSVLLWFYRRRKKSVSGDPPPRYVNSSLSSEAAAGYLRQLETVMREEQPYLDPKLTLAKLSERLQINKKELSQVINQHTGENYSAYVTRLRVTEAQRRLREPEYGHFKIASIAYDSGFNSLSSFNASFKKLTGTTAKAFREHSV